MRDTENAIAEAVRGLSRDRTELVQARINLKAQGVLPGSYDFETYTNDIIAIDKRIDLMLCKEVIFKKEGWLTCDCGGDMKCILTSDDIGDFFQCVKCGNRITKDGKPL